MRLVKYGVTFLACSVAFAAGSSAALARPHHHHIRHHERVAHHAAHHHRHLRAEYRSSAAHAMAAAVPAGAVGGPGGMPEYNAAGSESFAAVAPVQRSRVRGRHGERHERVAAEPMGSVGGFSGNALVADARRYLGTNPTDRRTLWCGAFMDKILRDTGHRGGGNLAKGYLNYGRRVSGPQVGAIAVMGRRGGGHVGVVSGVDPNGNPIIVSGNHNRTVAESVYPRSRIIAYVEPGS